MLDMNKVKVAFNNMINNMSEEDLNEMVERNLEDDRRRVAEDLEMEDFENRMDLIDKFENEGYTISDEIRTEIEEITEEFKSMKLKSGRNLVTTLRIFKNDDFKYFDLYAIVKNKEVKSFRIYNNNNYTEYETLVEVIIKWENEVSEIKTVLVFGEIQSKLIKNLKKYKISLAETDDIENIKNSINNYDEIWMLSYDITSLNKKIIKYNLDKNQIKEFVSYRNLKNYLNIA